MRRSRGTTVAVLLVIGAGCSSASSGQTASDKVSRSYTPVASSINGTLKMPAVWTGQYSRVAGAVTGTLSIHGEITGNWSGSGVLELSLPPGWKAAPAQESATMTGFAAPTRPLNLHAPLFGVLHAGATKLRFIGPDTSGKVVGWWLAVDGVRFPFRFTGGANARATVDVSGQVRLG